MLPKSRFFKPTELFKVATEKSLKPLHWADVLRLPFAAPDFRGRMHVLADPNDEVMEGRCLVLTWDHHYYELLLSMQDLGGGRLLRGDDIFLMGNGK